jgi:hypothetical protein
MSENKKPETGTIGWFDLTVPNAEDIKDFYSAVVGWKTEPLSMGEYNDYIMKSMETGLPVAGICHAKGVNANLPQQWLIYINVESIDLSVKRVLEFGGKILKDPKEMAGYGKFCIIQDPANAVCALFEPLK